MIKRPKEKEPVLIYLDRKWSKANIPHFRSVIDGVKKEEGIEITLTCNLEAFKFAIAYLEYPEDNRDYFISEKVTAKNCLSILVTCEFLQLPRVAAHVSKLSFFP